jgi:hypothetical protein
MASRYSSVRPPRRANGTPSAANSSADHPTPTPSINRPSLSRSRLAALLATTTGLSSGSSSTPVASRIRSVTAQAKPRTMNGSSRSAPAGTAICPSAEYG